MVEYESTFTKEECVYHRMLAVPEVTETLKCVHVAMMRTLALHGDRPDPGWRDKRGGVFCMADYTGSPLLTALIGEVQEGKVPKYTAHCLEKATRLGRHMHHLTSWESRNPRKNWWSGAVRIGGVIWSFSGLPEMGDEAAMLGAACQYGVGRGVGLTYRGWADAIALQTDNRYWEGLRDVLDK